MSIRQPWAWLIVHDSKRIENRTWNARYRGPQLIHAGVRVDEEAREEFAARLPAELPVGGYVGRAVLVDVVTESAEEWFFGPFGFVLDDVQPIAFTPGPGRLGLYAPPAGLPTNLKP